MVGWLKLIMDQEKLQVIFLKKLVGKTSVEMNTIKALLIKQEVLMKDSFKHTE